MLLCNISTVALQVVSRDRNYQHLVAPNEYVYYPQREGLSKSNDSTFVVFFFHLMMETENQEMTKISHKCTIFTSLYNQLF